MNYLTNLEILVILRLIYLHISSGGMQITVVTTIKVKTMVMFIFSIASSAETHSISDKIINNLSSNSILWINSGTAVKQ